MEQLTAAISALESYVVAHAAVAYVILFFGSYFDAVIGINFIVRGEVFFLGSAVLAGAGTLNIGLVTAIAFTASMLGDNTSYWLGRGFGRGLFRKNRTLFNPDTYASGKHFFDRFGAKAVLLARLLGPLTWVTPFIAGMYKAPYRQFILYDVLGVMIGVGQFILMGYLFGAGYQKAGSSQTYAALGMAAIGLLLFLFFLFRARITRLFMRLHSLWK